MSFLVLGGDEVRRLLPLAECVDLMAEALAALARGEAYQPLRVAVRPPRAEGFFLLMPAHVPGPREALGFKAVSVFEANAERGLDTHGGVTCLLDPRTGALAALVDAGAVTAIRTAAVSALATRLLAREDASVLAVLGAGVQARAHVEAVRAVRRVREVRIWSRSADRARALAAEVGAEAAASAEAAVRGADVVCTATAAREPILRREWLAPGAHVNAVGYAGPSGRELDAATVCTSALFVDSRDAALAESGDVVLAAAEAGADAVSIRAELGEVVAGLAPGRLPDDDVTVFESLGLAVEDLAAAEHLLRRAREQGAGLEVAFG